MTLSPKERKALKAQAHKLEPVVLIGNKGLTSEVVAEIDRALQAHELIKIRAPGLERDDREQALSDICEKTGAHPVQHIGKVLVVYRENPDQDD
jgi:RNA-binding protein